MLAPQLIPADYWAFLAGLNGFILFMLSLALREDLEDRPLYLSLGFFGLLQWLQQWLPLLLPALGPVLPLPETVMVLTAGSLTLLGLGGAQGLARIWLRWLLRVAVVAALLGGAMGVSLGSAAFFRFAFSALGVLCSVLAGLGLVWEGRAKGSEALRLAGLAVLGYGLALVMAGLVSSLDPEDGGPAGRFWSFWQAYLPVLQVFFGFLLTILLWLFHQRETGWLKEQPGVRGTRGQPFFFIGSLLLLLFLGGIMVGLFGRSLELDMRQTLASQVRSLAAALPKEEIRALTGTQADQERPAYRKLKKLLEDIRIATRDSRFVYLLRFRQGQPIFLVDSEPEDSPEISPPGQVYVEASAQLKAMADCPYAFVEGPETDRWGTWISAFEVIRDPQDQTVLALLGLDIDIRDWQRQIALHKLLPISIVLLMVILLNVYHFSQMNLMASAFRVAQSEERYRSLVEGTPNGVCLFDGEGRCLAINGNGLEMLGTTAQQVLNRPFWEHWPLPVQPRLQEAFEQVRRDQQVGLTLAFTPAAGPVRIWQIFINPIHNDGHQVSGSVGIFLDITEQKQAEEALRTSRALLQSLLEAIPDLLVVIDRDYRVVFSNNREKCFLPDPDLGQCPTCYRVFQNRPDPCPNCPAQSVFASGRTVEWEDIQPETGQAREVRAFPVFDGSGRVTMVIEYVRDITERKAMEEALRSREAKLQSIFRAAPVGIGLVEDRIFKEINDRVCQMTGYSREELVGQSSRLLYPSQEEFDYVGQEKYRQIQQKGEGTVETRWQRRDGSIIDILLSSAPLWPDIPSRVMLFTALDITEKKRLESLQANLEKMESLGIMAGGIAHDFNNVLMALLGNISLLGMTTNLAEIREGLHDMEQACRQGRLLAKQLLTFAKGGAPVKQLSDIKLLVGESVRLALSGSKAKTNFSWPEQLWQAEVDVGQMHQVFTNLLINADQAMPAGGQIDITAENCLLEEGSSLPLPPGKYLLIKVADQGVGIAPEHLDKIFDPYFTTKQKGSGLGLTMAYSIVSQHGGLITCDSQLGRGTTFSIYLPAKEPDAHITVEVGETLFPGQGRILVLEDEPAIQTVMEKMLKKLGYESAIAPIGQEVLHLYAQARQHDHPFDAVILDLTIPGGMGGLETCQRLREMDPQVKAIVSSGYADDPVLADYRSYGFSGVIAKPYRLLDLSKVLHQVLS